MTVFSPARILKGVGGQYVLAGSDRTTGLASVRGLFRKEGHVPTPGDWVEAVPSGDPDIPWRITKILPRKNELVRPTVTNLDCLIITLSSTDPAPDFQLADKLLVVCLLHQIEPILCITKTDMPGNQAEKIEKAYQNSGVTIVRTCPEDKASHDYLRQLLFGRVVSFAGQSGVGKSTLLNQLFGNEKMETGEVSDRIGRGRHTTRYVELFSFLGGYLADTPGFSSLELSEFDVRSQDLVVGYPEIKAIADQCRFAGCKHLGELGCAIDHATIDAGRLARYRQFRTELDQIKPYTQSRGRTRR